MAMVNGLVLLFVSLVTMAAAPSSGGVQTERASERPKPELITLKTEPRSAMPCLQTADLNNITEIGIYPYEKEYESRRCFVQASITNQTEIGWVAQAFKAKDKDIKDGRHWGTFPNAYVYLRDSVGHTRKATVILDWQYILLDDKWDKVYPLPRQGGEVLHKRFLALFPSR
jgi:hypothetical protein